MWLCRAGLSVALALVPLCAHAANGLRPRTPAQFADVPCIVTVDRSVDPVFHIDYAVPFDDIELTEDELPDSRRHQFFALAQQTFDFRLPVWINQSDFDRAQQNGDITKEFGDEDILERSAVWPAGTWVRITPDDPRIPITVEQANMGVDWDTTDVAVGTWFVGAYTWEPENNLWAFRFGAVRIVDPTAPGSGAPAGFLAFEDNPTATVGQAYAVPACVAADSGSTMTASWGILEGLTEPAWVDFAAGQSASDGDFSLEFVPPAEAAGQQVKIRLEITDPDGRNYVAFTPTPIQVFGGVNDSDGDDGGGDGGKGGCAGCMVGGSSQAVLFGVLLGWAALHRGTRRRRPE